MEASVARKAAGVLHPLLTDPAELARNWQRVAPIVKEKMEHATPEQSQIILGIVNSALSSLTFLGHWSLDIFRRT